MELVLDAPLMITFLSVVMLGEKVGPRRWLALIVGYANPIGLGLHVWAGWMYFMSRGYSLAQASVAAPFEYVGLPISVMWGFVIWHEIPSLMTLAGAF